MEIFKFEGGQVFVNNHCKALFPLYNPTKKLVPTPQIGTMMMMWTSQMIKMSPNKREVVVKLKEQRMMSR